MATKLKLVVVNHRQEQSAIVKTIGARMREAREMCNLSQSKAAERLGYSNSSKLAKVENATDTNSVPLWLIRRAAGLYEVSIDFLYGVRDDWEAGSRITQEREISGYMFDLFEQARTTQYAALMALHNEHEALRSINALMLQEVERVDSAMCRFSQLNSGFDDMRGGATLRGSIDRASEASVQGRKLVERFRLKCKLASRSVNQLSLML